MPTHGRSGVRTTDLLYRTRQRYPHSAPPKYFGVPQMSGCPSPRHLCVLLVRRQYRLRHVQPFFPRSLQAHADVSRRWRASSPPFFANLSPPAGAREHRAKVLWFCSIMFARTPSQLFEAFECQHHPGLSKVSHSQLRQLHADKIMTFRHLTIA